MQKELLPNLRKVSRQKYLKKRINDKLQDLEAILEDKEFLFGDTKLTAKEQKYHMHKKEVYKLVKQCVRISHA